MKRLLKLLLVTTLILPLITGTVAVLSGFGDPWGMGATNPWGVFVTAALPILPPGLCQSLAWPLTYGAAILMSPLALLQPRRHYLIATLLYLAAISGIWLLGWAVAPDRLNVIFETKSYVPGRLNSGVWKFGVYLLTDATLLAAATSWWFWRESGTDPSLQRIPRQTESAVSLFVTSVVAGGAIWAVFAALGTEPWDSPYGWIVVAGLGLILGFLGKGNPVFWPLGIFLGEVLYGAGNFVKSLFFYSGGGVNLFFPLGLMFLVPFTVPAFIGSFVGFWLRKTLNKKLNPNAQNPCAS